MKTGSKVKIIQFWELKNLKAMASIFTQQLCHWKNIFSLGTTIFIAIS